MLKRGLQAGRATRPGARAAAGGAALLCGGLLALAPLPTPAAAQVTVPIIQPVLPLVYDRGRNTGVVDRARPEFDAVGLLAGGFTIFPKLEVGLGGTDNLYETDLDKRGSAFVAIQPTVRIVSNWSRDKLELDGGADLRRFTADSIRNENGWYANASGQLDLGSDASVAGSGSFAKRYETAFSGASPADISSAVPFRDGEARLSASDTLGRVRVTGAVNYSDVNFASVPTVSGTRLDESYRNRSVVTPSIQANYALTPDMSVFAHLSYSDASYSHGSDTSGIDRSSHQVEALAGVEFDLTELMRGVVGIGYSDRRYLSSAYSDTAGVSLEGRLQYFLTPLTTVTLQARRAIQDAAVNGSSSYFDTGGGIRIDHELLRNLLLHAGLDYEVDDFRGINYRTNIFSVNSGGRFMFNQVLGLEASVSYGQRRNHGIITGYGVSETSGLLSIIVQR